MALLLLSLLAGVRSADVTLTTFDACLTTSALTLTNYVGRSVEILACIQTGFQNDDLMTLTDAIMNQSLARTLRDIYSSCIRSFEQPNYFLGYMANALSSNQATGLFLGVGNTVNQAYALSRPSESIKRFYTPSLKAVTSPAAVSGYSPASQPWFQNALATRNLAGSPLVAFTSFPDSTVKGSNGTTLSIEVPMAGYNGIARAVVAVDVKIPPLPTCSGFSLSMRDIHLPPSTDPTQPGFQIMSVSTGSPSSMIPAVMTALMGPSKDTPQYTFDQRITTTITVGTRKASLDVMFAGTYARYNWYSAIVRYKV